MPIQRVRSSYAGGCRAMCWEQLSTGYCNGGVPSDTHARCTRCVVLLLGTRNGPSQIGWDQGIAGKLGDWLLLLAFQVVAGEHFCVLLGVLLGGDTLELREDIACDGCLHGAVLGGIEAQDSGALGNQDGQVA